MRMKHLFLLLFFSLGVVAVAHGQTSTRTLVVTIDDLPYVNRGGGDYLENARAATAKMLRSLRKYKVPAVVFVNEQRVQEGAGREARVDLLRQWVKSGMTLANHTYSHADFNRLTVEQFEEEIVKGEIVSRQLMRERGRYQLYFRHPMTHIGDTTEKKEAIEKFLAARGYKVTPHTIDGSDFVFNVPYADAVKKGDEALARRLLDSYLEVTMVATEFAEKISPQIFGREIPQVLVIHSNDINADSLDELLERLVQRGYKFVTLDKAMADPAYETKVTYITKHGPTWLFRWAQSKGLKLDFSGDPDPPKWVLDMYSTILKQN